MVFLVSKFILVQRKKKPWIGNKEKEKEKVFNFESGDRKMRCLLWKADAPGASWRLLGAQSENASRCDAPSSHATMPARTRKDAL